MIAPVALGLAILACLIVLMGQGSDGSSAPEESATGGAATTSKSAPADKSVTVTRSSYTVKAGDSFSAIAEKTGVEIGELQRLNPEIDPRALQPGQKLKLKE